jgi:thymidine kinase
VCVLYICVGITFCKTNQNQDNLIQSGYFDVYPCKVTYKNEMKSVHLLATKFTINLRCFTADEKSFFEAIQVKVSLCLPKKKTLLTEIEFKCLGAVEKFRKATIRFVMSVYPCGRPSVCPNSSVPTG